MLWQMKAIQEATIKDCAEDTESAKIRRDEER